MPSRSVLPGNIAGAVSNWIQEGVSQRGALRILRSPEVGLKVGDTRFRAIWNQVKTTIANRPAIASLATNRIPDRSLYSDWSTGKPGMYAHHVGLIVRDTASGTTSTRIFTYMSRRQVSPNTAIAEAMNIYNDGIEENPEYAGEVVEGGVLTGLNFTVPAV